MARQEQDSMAHPAGVGPAGQFVPGSPGAGMVDPNIPPNVRAQMMLNQQNGGQPMQRPPSSHPMGNLTPQQVEMMRQQAAQQQGQMPNGAFQPPQGQMMQAQQGGQPGQPGQGQPMGTPRQQNNNMPPPPAPQTNAGGTQPSSPSAQAPAPPTPSQTKAAKPGTKKEAAAKKGAANKKGGNANATPATESEAPPTPTPATPATPMNKNSFAHQQNQQLSNGQPAAPAQANAQANNVTPQQNQTPQQQQNAVQQPAPPSAPDMNGPFGSLPLDDTFGDIGLGFGESDLDGFDFDSFLNTGDGVGTFEFDANLAFDGMDSSGGIEG